MIGSGRWFGLGPSSGSRICGPLGIPRPVGTLGEGRSLGILLGVLGRAHSDPDDISLSVAIWAQAVHRPRNSHPPVPGVAGSLCPFGRPSAHTCSCADAEVPCMGGGRAHGMGGWASLAVALGAGSPVCPGGRRRAWWPFLRCSGVRSCRVRRRLHVVGRASGAVGALGTWGGSMPLCPLALVGGAKSLVVCGRHLTSDRWPAATSTRAGSPLFPNAAAVGNIVATATYHV